MKEKAIIVGIYRDKRDRSYAEETLEELKELAETAGAEVVGRVLQRRSEIDPAYFIGKGKVEEIAAMVEELGANLVIFDDNLSPAQHRNIEAVIDAKVLDRTQLILDIFAQRAMTKEGKLQVELAQLTYLLPRLTGRGVHMSRLGGGIGTRGPGETKLEYDRRRIKERIKRIKKEIEEVRSRREIQRKKRKREHVPVVALVGYTSAGKTTLFNYLTREHRKVSRQLFTTLDPILRRVELPNGFYFLLSDTVGFIRKLPVELVTAFRATLEETVEADLILHVVDFSHENYMEHIEAVEKILSQIGVSEKPVIKVMNKIDLLRDKEVFLQRNHRDSNTVYISAKTGEGVDALLEVIGRNLFADYEIIEGVVPYSHYSRIRGIFRSGLLLENHHTREGVHFKLGVRRDEAEAIKTKLKEVMV